jgi:hypothetical protein
MDAEKGTKRGLRSIALTSFSGRSMSFGQAFLAHSAAVQSKEKGSTSASSAMKKPLRSGKSCCKIVLSDQRPKICCVMESESFSSSV